MRGTSTQPSKVSTEDTPAERPANVVTDDAKHSAASDPTAAPDGDPKNTDPGQKTDEPAPSDDDKQKPRRNRAAERKIARLTKRLKQQESRSEQDQATIQSLQSQIDELKQGQATPAKKPNIRDFKDPEEYARAHNKWEAAQKKGDDKKRAPDPDRNQPPASEPEPIDEEERKAFITRGKEKLGDEFLEAMEDKHLPINQVVGEYLLDSDLGPDLYVWLYNNPDEAVKLAGKSESAATRQLDKLSTRIKEHGSWDLDDDGGEKGKKPDDAGDQGEGKGKSSKRKTTNAPEPPGDTDTGHEAPDGDLESMGMDDYAKMRRRQMKTGPRF